MVSVAIMVLAMLAVGYIFSSVSKTSGLTTANIELTDSIDVLQRIMQEDLRLIVPGVLIIQSPLPMVDLRDRPGEPLIRQTRADAMAFLASGPPGYFQSFWNPRVTSSEAVLFFGQGLNETMSAPPNLFDRVLCRRAILFVPETLTGTPELNGGWSGYVASEKDPNYLPPTTLGETVWGHRLMFNQLNSRLTTAKVDVVQTHTLTDLVFLLRGLGDPNRVADPNLPGLTDRCFAPAALPRDPTLVHERGRGCFNLMHRVGDVIVEWTDGSVADPRSGSYDGRLQWFGLGRDVDGDGVIALGGDRPGSADVVSRTRWSTRYGQPVAPISLLELAWDDRAPPASYGSSPGTYRAVWTEDTWAYRPKAIRITVRLYDQSRRVRDADGRLGREYAFVLQVP